MNKTVKKLWIDNLRSGKFKQGYGRLQDVCGGYCCLGVLQKILNLEITEFDIMLSPEASRLAGIDRQPSVNLTKKDIKKYSLQHAYWTRKVSLNALNDVFHFNFNKIADIIEKYL